jgi:hypothetical protein
MTLLYEDGVYELWDSTDVCVPEIYQIDMKGYRIKDHHPLGGHEDG